MTLAAGASQANDWVEMTFSERRNYTYDYREHSLEMLETELGLAARALIRRRNLGEQQVEFYKSSVTQRDCVMEHGEVRFLSLSGATLATGDFAFDGGSVGSGIAKFLCNKTWEYEINKLVADSRAELDYAASSDAVKAFDSNLPLVKASPQSKGKTIRWIVQEAHRKTLGR